MSRKAILLAIGWLIASVLGIKAQVYSVNAVGYLNKTIPPGFSLISVPLASTEEIRFPMGGALPSGFALYILRDGKFEIARLNPDLLSFNGAELSEEDFSPGGGFFAYNPSPQSFTVTFVGQILQGSLTNSIPAGFSIQSSIVPQAGTPQALGFPFEPGDAVYHFHADRQEYKIYVLDELELRWLPSPPPALETGDAFIVRTLRAKDWVREFSVNQ